MGSPFSTMVHPDQLSVYLALNQTHQSTLDLIHYCSVCMNHFQSFNCIHVGWLDVNMFCIYVTCRYDIMLKCWQINADERPSFSTLVVLVSTDLEHQAGYLDFSFPNDAFPPKDSEEKCLPSPSPSPAPAIVVTQADSDTN